MRWSANSPGVVLDVNFVSGSRMSFIASVVPCVSAVVALKGAFVSSTVVCVIQPDIINMPRRTPPQYLSMMWSPSGLLHRRPIYTYLFFCNHSPRKIHSLIWPFYFRWSEYSFVWPKTELSIYPGGLTYPYALRPTNVREPHPQ